MKHNGVVWSVAKTGGMSVTFAVHKLHCSFSDYVIGKTSKKDQGSVARSLNVNYSNQDFFFNLIYVFEE